LLSGATIVMSYCVALRKRPMVLSIVLGMYSIGSAVGPLVGGAITDNKKLTWRFIFWINLRKSRTLTRLVFVTDRSQLSVLLPWP
jgi:MFS family permease